MELKMHFNVRKLLVLAYFVAFSIYLVIGFMPAEASDNGESFDFVAPTIGLSSEVVDVELHDGKLATPDTIIGRYNSGDNNVFLFGHSSTVFSNLHNLRLNDEISYMGKIYSVTKIELLAKAKIKMGEVLSSRPVDTLTIMTCAGEYLENGDATHRLILTATVK